jgi:hypothetical protein
MTREEALIRIRMASSRRTICEVHREIYDACCAMPENEKAQLRELVLEAFIMAKKMDAKLREYKSDWDDGFFEKNIDRMNDIHKRSAHQ